MSTSRSEWHAFGSLAVLCTTEESAVEVARAEVERVLQDFDRTCNRFDPASELARVNALAGRRVQISSLLTQVLAVALDVAKATDGAVDPTVGASLEAAGYDRDIAAIEASEAPAAYVPAAGWRRVDLDAAGGSVFVPAGVKLDLGSTGKAMAVDMATAAAARAVAGGVLFSLGGDLAVAGPPPPGGWPVNVTDDHAAHSDSEGQTIMVGQGALATSSTLVRRWRRRDDVHHILDPRTGAPAPETWCTVSVAAPNCVSANAYATAAIILGDRAADRLAALRLPARLRSRDGQVRHLEGWPAYGETRRRPRPRLPLEARSVDLVSDTR